MIAAAATTTATPPKPDPEFVHRAAWKAGVLGSLNVLFAVISARFILLVAVLGALFLAKLALDVPEPVKQSALIMLGVYCASVVLPVVWLASRR